MPRRLPTALLTVLTLAASAAAETNWTPRVRAVADFLLDQQTPQGCIPDSPGDLRANRDSAMEQALLGLAFAFHHTQDGRAQRGLRDGLGWLAACMDKTSGPWAGSWRFAYSSKPPYLALPTSPCPDVDDARGNSATCALFAYLVALHSTYTGDETVARTLKPHVRAALDFLLQRNQAPNDLFYAAWHSRKGASDWALDRMQPSADQATVYLGLLAGYSLLGHPRYKQAADKLYRAAPRLLFHKRLGAFGLGLDPRGQLIPPDEKPESYFTQGYLTWAFGPTDETQDAVKWLQARMGPDDSVRAKAANPACIVSAAALCMGCARASLYPSQAQRVERWLREHALTSKGGVRQMVAPNAPVENRLAAWLLAAWLNPHPLPFPH